MRQSRILIVDDERSGLDILTGIFRENYGLMVALNGEQALARARSTPPPDLILLDVMMPGMDGYEVCRRLKADATTRDIPVIFVTGMTDVEDEAQGLELGAVDYITKPYSPPIVEARLKTHLRLRQTLQELEKEQARLEQHSRFIRKTFGRYLSDDIVDRILDSPDGLELGGEKLEVSVMMADLRGFTSIAERLPPESVVAMLNNYLKAMTNIIMRYEGTIDEFIGDAILAIFGAPIHHSDHAKFATACAIEMQCAMAEVNERNRDEGHPEVAMGIGICTGEVVVGNIGCEARSKYGVVGRHVNLASRIQSCAVGGQVLISESTARSCGPILDKRGEMEIQPKGFDAPMPIYEIGGIGDIYGLSLPEKPEVELVEPKEPLKVRFGVFSGKSVDPNSHEGAVVGLAEGLMAIQTDAEVERLTDVWLTFVSDEGGKRADQMYGKVVESPAGSMPNLTVNLTSIPPSAAAILAESVPVPDSISASAN